MKSKSPIALVADEIRKAFKSAGIKAKVRSESYSMGSEIRVHVISGDYKQAEEIAKKFESIRRDHNGDILSGGNLYVDVEWSDAVVDAKAEEIREVFESAIAKCHDDQFENVEGTDISVATNPQTIAGYYVSREIDSILTSCLNAEVALRRAAILLLEGPDK